MSQIRAVRGTRDLLPPETELWNRIESTARSVFARYGFGEVRTPIFEDTQLFSRSVGEDTDIVSKEMYTWEDGERFWHEKLKEAWIDLHGPRVRVLEQETYVGPQGAEPRIDLIAEIDSKIVLVEFKSKADPQFGARMLSAARSVLERARGSEDISLRLVIPSGTRYNPELFNKNGITVEELAGDFFLSTQSLTLRPENTAGVVRAYIEHNLGDTGMLQKLYYIGPQFRRERPQKGRYRQFFQIGAEVIGPPSAGSESPLRDAEVLEMLASYLGELGISGWTLDLNSVGSSADRPRYVEALRAALRDVAPTMCVDCQRRAVANPLRVLDCKVPEDQPKIDALPKIADFLDDDSRAHFGAVLAALDACGISYRVNPRLVRGLDYYTRTTFEFTHGGLGAQNALLGGGRYDGLSEAIGGPKAPGIGFAIGADRLVLTLQAARSGNEQPQLADAYIAPIGEAQQSAALVLARDLRRAGLRIELGDGSFRLKKSFEVADKLARSIVLFGEDESRSGIITVKEFQTGEQKKVSRNDLVSTLRQR